MAKVTFTLDDETLEHYQHESKERHVPGGVAQVLNERLRRAIPLDPRDRPIIITGGRAREIIEEKLGGGNLKDTEDLLRKVTALAVIKFGEHEFKLTAGHYRELAFRATKTGKSVDQLLQETFTKMQAQFFEYVP